MNEQIKAGADIHAGDGGYREGTQEEYAKFAQARNYPLAENNRQGWVCSKCGVDRTLEVCPKGHTAAVTGECPMILEAQ